MAFRPVPEGIQVVARFTLNGQQAANVYHFKSANSFDGVVLAAVAGWVRDMYVGNILPGLSAGCALVQVEARDISQEGGQASVLNFSPGLQGGQSGDPLPGNVAFVITHRTARIGRAYRGRTYIPGLPESLVSGNTLGGTAPAGFAAGFNALIATAQEANTPFCILSRQVGGAVRTTPVLTPVVLSVARNTRVDSQRRRLGRD